MTVKEAWVEFSDAVMPEEAHPMQWQEMRRAFFAGYKAALQEFAEIGQMGKRQALKCLEDREEELDRFSRDVLEGRA